MVRAFLVFVAILGALGVGFGAGNAGRAESALQAIGIGVALLLFATGLGLADLINLGYEIRHAVYEAIDANAKAAEAIDRLRRRLAIQPRLDDEDDLLE